MSLEPHQIAEAFNSWRFAETFPYMADDIQWHVVGREEVAGREAVIAKCAASTKFLATVSAQLTRLDVHRAGTCVIVEGAARFQGRDDNTFSVASCDIFRFSDERLVEITSYVIDL